LTARPRVQHDLAAGFGPDRWFQVPRDAKDLSMRATPLILGVLFTVACVTESPRPPIFDVHLHAQRAADQGPPPLGLCTPARDFPAWDPARPYDSTYTKLVKEPPCDDPVWSPETDDGVRTGTLEVMERFNIFGVLSGADPGLTAQWMEAAPGRFVPGTIFDASRPAFSPDSLRRLFESRQVQVLGEVVNQYAGVAPDDSAMAPYWQLAEELDIPVGIHLGTGPPGVHHLGATGYRAAMHSALTLEPVLVRHPKLRVYIMHAGWPMADDLLALLYAHPQVYVDVGIISYGIPDFESYLRRIVEAGFGTRVMFGSDQMLWPGAIPRAIQRIENMSFLTPGQKRDIFYNNAARFFRFTPEEIDRHHGR
jgi:predicted TIM-barrel fold metal-dependent hydrolase